jgi:methionyl aminopeptidase
MTTDVEVKAVVEVTALEKILKTLGEQAIEGRTSKDLEQIASLLCSPCGLNVEAVFPGQKPEGHTDGYPNILCVSVNNEVIHGIPNDKKFEEGDVVSIDCGIRENGLIYDGAITVLVGQRDAEGRVRGCSAAARKLVKATQEALEAGIAAAVAGKTNWTITEAIEEVAKKYDFNVVEGYGGHGVGTELHEEPFIANRAADNKGKAVPLVSGMRLAIEPMFCTNHGATYIDVNGWTVKVRSGLAAHFEKTILIP